MKISRLFKTIFMTDFAGGLFIAIKKGKQKKYGAIIYIIEYINYNIKNLFRQASVNTPKISLRKLVNISDKNISSDNPQMSIIRQGR